MDSIEATKLAEIVILNCKGKVDQYIEPFIELALKRLDKAEGDELKMVLIEVVSCSLYYNPMLTLHILEQKNWTQATFTRWFQHLPNFRATHDKKICILGLSSILQITPEQLPPVVRNSINNFSNKL